MITLESYKSIWTLLDINPDVVIYFDSENTIKTHQEENKVQLPKEDTPVINPDELSSRVAYCRICNLIALVCCCCRAKSRDQALSV